MLTVSYLGMFTRIRRRRREQPPTTNIDGAAAEEGGGGHRRNNFAGGGLEESPPTASSAAMGIYLKTIRPGDASNFPSIGDTVRIHYEGYLGATGEMIHSTRGSKRAFQFTLGAGQVVEGMDVAVGRMSPGQVAEVTIPPIFAYGKGYPPLIPMNSTLLFRIELLDILGRSSTV